jgi:hypothetical protein
VGKQAKEMKKADICQGRTLNVVCHRDADNILNLGSQIVNSGSHKYIVSVSGEIAWKNDQCHWSFKDTKDA